MKYGALALCVAALVAPAASAQNMWWVDGDRYCNSFGNRNSAMCGPARRGETVPRPTFRLEFNTPQIDLGDRPRAPNLAPETRNPPRAPRPPQQ